ncbi:MAG: lytic transglycosylase domain-containing protein, partial [Snodgrassella sp.]|nr:lytic transglycosylase domain-containing protein [Snodgrassella sp.]
FRQQYTQLDKNFREQETRCYAALAGIENDADLLASLSTETGNLPQGCNRWLEQAAARQQISTQAGWRRVRYLLALNQITNARNLAQALGSPLPDPLSSRTGGSQGAQEALLYQVINKENRSKVSAAITLQQLSASLTKEQTGFGWAQLGLAQAYNQNASNALNYFDRADPSQMSNDMWEWYARSALRLQRWQKLNNIILSMPQALQQQVTWQYWLARSYRALGQNSQAQEIFEQTAQRGRNFYSLLATEALGRKANTQSTVAKSSHQVQSKIAADGNIHRALTLFKTAQSENNWPMRRQAQQEWRYATRNYNDETQIAASTLAENTGFYEMSIYSADKADGQLNYELRYPAPFRELTVPYAQQAGIDPAWVYGLIRQESRFMIGARSSVGATGLMQVRPATARDIAKRLGMDSSELYTMRGNIRMGTWYMSNVRNQFADEVLATAGYNAGPGRARRWQANIPLEGAIYAETIPFDETRTYVKNVMANATYYANLFGESRTTLTERMGTVPAR